MSTDWLFSFCSKTGDGSLYIWSNANNTFLSTKSINHDNCDCHTPHNNAYPVIFKHIMILFRFIITYSSTAALAASKMPGSE